jgi:hypothetical protein
MLLAIAALPFPLLMMTGWLSRLLADYWLRRYFPSHLRLTADWETAPSPSCCKKEDTRNVEWSNTIPQHIKGRASERKTASTTLHTSTYKSKLQVEQGPSSGPAAQPPKSWLSVLKRMSPNTADWLNREKPVEANASRENNFR